MGKALDGAGVGGLKGLKPVRRTSYSEVDLLEQTLIKLTGSILIAYVYCMTISIPPQDCAKGRECKQETTETYMTDELEIESTLSQN